MDDLQKELSRFREEFSPERVAERRVEFEKKAELSRDKYTEIIGASTVLFRWDDFFRENPECVKRIKRQQRSFFEKYKVGQ